MNSKEIDIDKLLEDEIYAESSEDDEVKSWREVMKLKKKCDEILKEMKAEENKIKGQFLKFKSRVLEKFFIFHYLEKQQKIEEEKKKEREKQYQRIDKLLNWGIICNCNE